MTHDPPVSAEHIQGLALPGFLKPHQALVFFDLPESERPSVVPLLQQWLDEGCITTAARTLADREAHRAGQGDPDALLLGLACTAAGLDALCSGLADSVPSAAFAAGMGGRAGLLGDTGTADPSQWLIGGPTNAPQWLLVVAGDRADRVQQAVVALQGLLPDGDGLTPPPQFGNILAPGSSREHFGFADGVSQPGIRGTWKGAPITQRDLPNTDAEHDLFGHPGQHLVWPGEFVLGYPASNPDPRLPGPVRQVPPWMHDGSFLVYRRLRQNVEAFRQEMASEAARLDREPGFRGMNADLLAAKLVGRWPSGAPLSRSPGGDNDALGNAPLLNNDFRFDDATPRRQFPANALPAALQNLPPAPADILGLVCPVASHIRKVNLRDQASDVGGASATQSRRILRVGVPYDDTPQDGPPDRGLLFLSIQASIEDQFEFLQARWINSHVRPRGPGGNDMIVGRGERSCVIFGADYAQAEVRFKTDFVTMTGGGYFFVPSIPTLRALLRGDPLPS